MPQSSPPPPGGIAMPDQPQKIRKLPSANPLPLSASQEAQVRSTYYANVRGFCDKEIRLFAECAAGRTFSLLWNCKVQRHAMNDCMIKHATPEEQDRAREQWFQMRIEKARKRKEAENAENALALEKEAPVKVKGALGERGFRS